MARLRSPEKRSAILDAAVHEIALTGLSAPTSRIAHRAGVAEGTLFTYFSNKEELLNELYFELKMEVYAQLNTSFPHDLSLERQARHIWVTYLDWAIAYPDKRTVSVQLNLSNLIKPESRERTAIEREAVDRTFSGLGQSSGLVKLPTGFAASTMAAMQEVILDCIGKQPERRNELIEAGFGIFWRAIK